MSHHLALPVHHHTLRIVLAISGAVCQIAGFVWVLVEVSLARGREFEEWGLLGRALKFLFPWQPEPPRTTFTIAPYETDALLSLGPRPGETDLERVERELGNLRTEFAHYQRHADKRQERLREDVTELSERITDSIGHMAERQGELRRTSLKREWRGAWLFALGAALSAAAAVV